VNEKSQGNKERLDERKRRMLETTKKEQDRERHRETKVTQ
jgi:hypothetical protein